MTDWSAIAKARNQHRSTCGLAASPTLPQPPKQATRRAYVPPFRPDPPPRKADAPCCAATLDEYGRMCIGFCGPDCIRRPAVWAALERGER